MLSCRCMIRLLPHPHATLLLNLLMGEGGEGEGEEPNHTTSRKPDPLLIMASNKDRSHKSFIFPVLNWTYAMLYVITYICIYYPKPIILCYKNSFHLKTQSGIISEHYFDYVNFFYQCQRGLGKDTEQWGQEVQVKRPVRKIKHRGETRTDSLSSTVAWK